MITPVKMERALEIGNEAVGLLRTTFSPVNLNGELAEPHRPHNNVISESRTQNRSIGEELTIFSWNIFEGLNK